MLSPYRPPRSEGIHYLFARLSNPMPKHFLLRLLTLFCGLSLLSFGVALSIRSNLGTSPISSVPYVFSYIFPLSVGVLTIILHTIFILIQMAILGKQFQMIQWLQLVVGIVFGVFIDVALWLTQFMDIQQYVYQMSVSLISCVITAIGVILQVKARLIYLAGEGVYQAFAIRFHKNYGTVKTYGDVILVAFAATSSYLVLHQLIGIREGTIISAFLIGTLIRTMMPKFSFLDFK
ncbi:YitT family protein [Acinetobacter sp. WCHAc060033]|uniref:YczE/YyaS/YitT family protein n=1 Tax=Acinetobacter sp. WCHAc060033 TaxID=2518624 RepID=UPI001023F1FB|nr:DUF6198 family protein [Acinetobacter sp. WCHAc060033]RZG85059.1 YitT family protein [Acinetobacter sp. WCHAc060033]